MKIHIKPFARLLSAAICSVVCATASSAVDANSQPGQVTNPPGQSAASATAADIASHPPLPGERKWVDQAAVPIATLLCIHGLGLNSGAFDDFGTRMAHKGILTFAFDVRGFGEWMKQKNGEDLDFEGTLSDIKLALEAIRADHPGLPVFLLGESMGGAIVLKACSEYPQLMDGLISSAPGGSRYKQDRTDLEVGLRVLTRPRKQFDVGTGIVDQATKNDALRKVWQSDPLNRLDLSPVQLIKFQLFMDGNEAAVKKIGSTPVLVLQGTEDKLVRPDDTWKIFTMLTTERKTMVALRSEHLILEYGRVKTDSYDSKVATLVADWMQNSVPESNVYPSTAGADHDAVKPASAQ